MTSVLMPHVMWRLFQGPSRPSTPPKQRAFHGPSIEALSWPTPCCQGRLRAYLEEVLQHLHRAVAAATEDGQEDWATVGALLGADVPFLVLAELREMDFEVRKLAVRVFEAFLRLGAELGAEEWVSEYVRARPRMPALLLEHCGDPELLPFAGVMLRAWGRYPALLALVLEAGAAERMVRLALRQDADVSLEAFASLRELLLGQPTTAAEHVATRPAEFFKAYHELVRAEDYVTQRQALRLLGDVLSAPEFADVALPYVSSGSSLQLHMNLLRDRSRSIRVEAFRIFRLFVTSPLMPGRVQHIVCKNKERLVKMLRTQLLLEQCDSLLPAQVGEVVEIIEALQPPSPTSSLKRSISESSGSMMPDSPVSSFKRTMSESSFP